MRDAFELEDKLTLWMNFLRIFISSTGRDQSFVDELSEFLRQQNHQVDSWSTTPANARSVLEILDEKSQEADLFIIVWGRYSSQSRNAENELLAIKMLVDTDESKSMFPVVLDDVAVPIELSRYLFLKMDRKAPNFGAILSSLKRLETVNDETAISANRAPLSPDITHLQKAHQDGKLTLVCGAGISIGANIPPWNTLLDRLLDAMLKRLVAGKSDMAAARSELRDIRENSSLIAGRYLKNVLKGDFQEEVRKALYKDSDQSCSAIDAIVELARPKRGKAHLDSVISFNFDDLLERNFRSASIEHKPIFSEGSRSDSTELPIFHVHGYLPKSGKLNKNNQIVFSEDSYHDQFVDPFSWSNLTQLNKFTQNTCLFVGLSMTDPNLRRLLDVAIRRDGDTGARHYAVLKRNSDSSKNRMMESLREQDAASLGVSILWVDEFEDIPKLIRSLA